MVESLIISAGPHAAMTIAQQTHHGDVGQRGLDDGAIGFLYIHAVAIGAHPQMAMGVVSHG